MTQVGERQKYNNHGQHLRDLTRQRNMMIEFGDNNMRRGGGEDEGIEGRRGGGGRSC